MTVNVNELLYNHSQMTALLIFGVFYIGIVGIKIAESLQGDVVSYELCSELRKHFKELDSNSENLPCCVAK